MRQLKAPPIPSFAYGAQSYKYSPGFLELSHKETGQYRRRRWRRELLKERFLLNMYPSFRLNSHPSMRHSSVRARTSTSKLPRLFLVATNFTLSESPCIPGDPSSNPPMTPSLFTSRHEKRDSIKNETKNSSVPRSRLPPAVSNKSRFPHRTD